MIEVATPHTPPPKHIPPAVGSPMYFQNIGEGIYPVLVYVGVASSLYLMYLGAKGVASRLR